MEEVRAEEVVGAAKKELWLIKELLELPVYREKENNL